MDVATLKPKALITTLLQIMKMKQKGQKVSHVANVYVRDLLELFESFSLIVQAENQHEIIPSDVPQEVVMLYFQTLSKFHGRRERIIRLEKLLREFYYSEIQFPESDYKEFEPLLMSLENSFPDTANEIETFNTAQIESVECHVSIRCASNRWSKLYKELEDVTEKFGISSVDIRGEKNGTHALVVKFDSMENANSFLENFPTSINKNPSI